MADEKPLTHVDAQGRPAMVDVSAKAVTTRIAVAEGRIRMSPEAFRALSEGGGPKGDPLQVARVAGIMAGKRAGELIPLCHVLPAVSVRVDVEPEPGLPGVKATAEAVIADRTGVEMEALTAVSLALLTVYDMLKAVDRGMVLEGIRLVHKAGGRSGSFPTARPESGAGRPGG